MLRALRRGRRGPWSAGGFLWRRVGAAPALVTGTWCPPIPTSLGAPSLSSASFPPPVARGGSSGHLAGRAAATRPAGSSLPPSPQPLGSSCGCCRLLISGGQAGLWAGLNAAPARIRLQGPRYRLAKGSDLSPHPPEVRTPPDLPKPPSGSKINPLLPKPLSPLLSFSTLFFSLFYWFAWGPVPPRHWESRRLAPTREGFSIFRLPFSSEF